MKTSISQYFCIFATTSMLVTGVAEGDTNNTVKDKSKSIEQATTALNEAKTALESAQNTLSEAQKDQQTSRLKSKKTSTPTSQGPLYKWVDEYGDISYQDSPPPKNVNILNSDLLKDKNVEKREVREVRRADEPAPLLDGSTPVMVYTAGNCKPCQSVVLFLTQKQVPFVERDIRTDRKARERLSNLSKQISVPSLFIGERIIQGHSKPMITRALEEAGYLKPQK